VSVAKQRLVEPPGRLPLFDRFWATAASANLDRTGTGLTAWLHEDDADLGTSGGSRPNKRGALPKTGGVKRPLAARIGG
jgi:hypothetical protein